MKVFSAVNAWMRGHRPTLPPGQEPWPTSRSDMTAVPMRAYVNHGRWVADCVRPYCGGAELLRPGQPAVWCSNCRLVAPVEWPRQAQQIWEALQARPVPQVRNWYPHGHPIAVRHGIPHGQSAADLVAETAEHAHELIPGGGPGQIEGSTSWRGLLR